MQCIRNQLDQQTIFIIRMQDIDEGKWLNAQI